MKVAAPVYRPLRAFTRGLPDTYQLRQILELATTVGVKLPAAFGDRLSEIQATRKAASQVDDNLPPAERRHRSRQILQRADSLEAGARKLLDGPKIEAVAKRIVAKAVAELEKLALDPDITTVEDAARIGGADAVDRFLKVEAIENRIVGVWELMTLLRCCDVLPATVLRPERDRYQSLGFRLDTSTRDGWTIPVPHQFAANLAVAASSSSLRQKITLGCEPGVYTLDEARSHLEAYVAEAMSDQPPIPSGGRIL